MDLAEFLERYSKDDNQWWRLDVGDMQNLFDASVQQVAELRVEVARLRTELDIARDLLRSVPVPDYRSEYEQWRGNVEDYLETT